MVGLLDGMLHVSAAGEQTLLLQLSGQLRTLVASGRLTMGQRLPSSRRLAQSLGVSRNTVSAAIEQLTAEGYLITSPGRRAVVARVLPLVGRGAQDKYFERKADLPDVSVWARGLRHAAWPPRYEGLPRPFQPGLADSREFPHEIWGRCLRRAARSAQQRGSQRHNEPLNVEALQRVLLHHLAEHRGVKAKPEQIIVVPSAQAGLALIAKVMIDPGDLAWVESPGYGGAATAFQTAGATIVGVPAGKIGDYAKARSTAPRLIFVTPSRQYPTARLMPFADRVELLRYADAVGASVVEDDYDGEFHYDGKPVVALQGLAAFQRVFYLGTFSKSMFADVRVGYIVVPDDLIETFLLAQRNMGDIASFTIQDALAEFIATGTYLSHIRRMTRIYRARRDRMVQALAFATDRKLLVDPPAGGMQLLARSPIIANDKDLAAQLFEAGVITRPLSNMLFHKSKEQGLFLGFAAWNENEIDRAARIVGRIVEVK
jgi:GntR family transcriptional regulator/MocR family aminotransferase